MQRNDYRKMKKSQLKNASKAITILRVQKVRLG